MTTPDALAAWEAEVQRPLLDVERLIQAGDALRDALTDLLAAPLKKYLSHRSGCGSLAVEPADIGEWISAGLPCDCGLDAALQAGTGDVPVTEPQ